MRRTIMKKKGTHAGWVIPWLILLLALPGLPMGQHSTAHAAGGVELAAGGEKHTCIVINGGVQCWGDNTSGQLGDGTTEQRLQPTPVSGLESGVTALAAGNNHTCALTSTGGVKCWGANTSGQLGNNSTTSSSTPVDVTGLTNITALIAGANHTCALTSTGGVKCWGENGSGQLGNNSNNNSSTPVDVAGLSSGMTALAAGTSHTCTLTDTGGIKCWGNNGGGRLGDNTTNSSSIPVDVFELDGTAIALAAGFDHTCAVVNGGVKCWGDNRVGQLGNDSTTNSQKPVQVSNVTSRATVVVAGFRHTCALTDSGGVQCWGLNNTGQLGNGKTTNSTVPVSVQNLSSGVDRLAAGASHTCALTSNGGMQCWGANNSGQLGDGSLARLEPVNVEGLSTGVTALATGTEHNCAIIDGGVQCWGYNNRGQLGNDSTTSSATPVAVAGLTTGMSLLNTALAAGAGHSCAMTASGGVRCWGDNTYGQLGDNSTEQRLTAVAVVGLPDGSIVTALTAGNNHTCALLADGSVYCWGRNNNGQLGGATSAFSETPSRVQGSASVTALVAGADHTCVLSNMGERCWGANSSGQLGNQKTTNSAAPVLIEGLSGTVSTLAAGGAHTCVLTTDTGVQCWGANASGQLGDGTIEPKLQPVTISEFSADVPLGAGANHTCAATESGAACWGANGRGQLGDGTQANKLAPAAVQNLVKPAVLAGGSEHTCALVNDGVKCWGSNFRGQLGDGTNAQPLTPVTVIGTNTTLKLTVTPNKPAVKQAINLSVAMTASDENKPTGSVTFFNGSEELGKRNLDSEGTASLNIPGLPAGRYTLIARYAGDDQYMPSKDEQRVTVGVETEIALSAAPNPSRLGQTVTFIATVKSLGRSDQKLDGGVTFFNGAEELESVPLADDFTASTTTAELPLGEHLITATYTGNDYYISSTTDKDEAVNQVVDDRSVTTTTVEATPPSPAIFGQQITFTITVTGEGEGTPTGSITIKNGPDILAENIKLTDGSATWSPTTRQFPVGTYRITADYSGDDIYQPGTSMTMDYVVRVADSVQTQTTITAEPAPSIDGKPVTFTATVSATEGDGIPTGTVAFYSGNQPLGGKVSLTNGQAVLIESLPLGTYQIWAEYEGTAAYSTSRSAELTHEVVRRPTTTTLTAAPNPATLGQTITFNVVVAAAEGQPTPTGTVIFYNGDTELGTQELTDGTASLTTATLPVGQHTITVVYQGDDNYASSTSNEVIQEVRSPTVTGESRVYLPLIQR